jgi:hypothetical protein
VGIAVLLSALVPIKVALFFLLLTRFNLRARTSLLTSLSLANYSEFGLIVGGVANKAGWIQDEWLVTIAIAVSITFVLASPLNAASHSIYARLDRWLKRFETRVRRPDDQVLDPGDAEVAVFGMGEIGTGAYEIMRERYGPRVVGVDSDFAEVQRQQEAGRRVLVGDATDADFWDRIRMGRIRLVMLTLPSHQENLAVARRLAESDHPVFLAATAQFDDEAGELREAGVDAAFNVFAKAGAGFAESVCDLLPEDWSRGRNSSSQQ